MEARIEELKLLQTAILLITTNSVVKHETLSKVTQYNSFKPSPVSQLLLLLLRYGYMHLAHHSGKFADEVKWWTCWFICPPNVTVHCIRLLVLVFDVIHRWNRSLTVFLKHCFGPEGFGSLLPNALCQGQHDDSHGRCHSEAAGECSVWQSCRRRWTASNRLDLNFKAFPVLSVMPNWMIKWYNQKWDKVSYFKCLNVLLLVIQKIFGHFLWKNWRPDAKMLQSLSDLMLEMLFFFFRFAN